MRTVLEVRQLGSQEELESVKKRAARFVTTEYNNW